MLIWKLIMNKRLLENTLCNTNINSFSFFKVLKWLDLFDKQKKCATTLTHKTQLFKIASRNQ